MTDPTPRLPTHDEMLAEVRRLIVACANNCSTGDDVLAVAALLNAYTHAQRQPEVRA